MSKSNKLTKKERRAATREKMQALREQERKRAKRNRLIAGGIVALVLVISLVAIIKIVGAHKEENYTGTARAAELQNVTKDYGIPFGKDGKAIAAQEGLPQVGIYADYMCSHCIVLHHEAKEAYKEHENAGDVQLIQHPVATMRTEFSELGAAAVFYVATYAPDNFGDFNDALFAKSYDIMSEKSEPPSAEEIARIAAKAGVPKDVAADLPASITSEAWKKVVAESNKVFSDHNYKGTPTITVNGEEISGWSKVGMPEFLKQVAALKK
ncbi:thioredoxin domain-containing protein [uncultured Arcanobacterium sp.]|uniref:DsbA family protein n=1 Tax=uncultured Arcanobacterium sp. TaxID=487520 RepID=UPI002616A452|nr:thioredoxin domain-containing protein [uncultured Arcanobacterium sp.]